MKIDKFEVHLSLNTGAGATFQDITDIVSQVSLQESLHGDIEGSMYCQDASGVLDSLIGTNNAIVIKYTYFENPLSMTFYLDGVRDVRFDTGFKTYMVKLGSINTLLSSHQQISKVYKGLSSEILFKLYRDVYSEDLPLNILSDSKSEGKYIAPNISPKIIEQLVLLNAYGENQSPMFLYQALRDEGVTTLQSVDDMESLEAQWIITTKTDGDEPTDKFAPLGIADQIIVSQQYKKNIKKTNLGWYGKTLNTYDIEETRFESVPIGEVPSATHESRIFRKNLYGDGDTPLMNSFQPDLDKGGKQNGLVNHVELTSLRRVHLFAIKIRATNMSAIPMISVGSAVKVDIQDTKEGPNHIHKGKYIIAGITHNMSKSDQNFIYTQDMELVRR